VDVLVEYVVVEVLAVERLLLVLLAPYVVSVLVAELA
jgi:hypothetical protein